MKAAYKKYNLSIPEMADEGYARPCATFTRHPKPSVLNPRPETRDPHPTT